MHQTIRRHGNDRSISALKSKGSSFHQQFTGEQLIKTFCCCFLLCFDFVVAASNLANMELLLTNQMWMSLLQQLSYAKNEF